MARQVSRRFWVLGGLLAVVVVGVGFQYGSTVEPYTPSVPLGIDWSQARIPQANPLGRARVELGKRLFFDGRLLGSATCANCHVPSLGFTGGPAMGRDAPTLINRAFSTLQFWDGRGASLEEVMLMEVLIDVEDVRKGGWELTPEVREEYRAGFQAAFGSGEVTYERAAMAIAAFVRTLLSGNSAFDHYEYGGEEQALSEAAKRGLTLFRTKARCSRCHTGFNFTDEQFHNLGVGWDPQKQAFKDTGRLVWTGREEDRGAFKTPTVRDVARTAPYLHDGSLKTLEEVVDFYNRGGNPNPYLDLAMQPLHLSDQEKADLVALLEALSGDWHEADYTSR